jgi:hypothetical protein
MRQDGARVACLVILADSRPQVDRHAQRKEARNAVNDRRTAKIVIAQIRDKPAEGIPAPGSTHHLGKRAEDYRHHQTGPNLDPLDQRARQN